MNTTTTIINTRYVESDQMGIIHHSNYLIYMEQARLEWLDNLGFSYTEFELNKVLLPVYQIDIKYKQPIKFGQQVFVKTSLAELPTTRVHFNYQIYTNQSTICATAMVTLVFTDADSFRPIKPLPDFVDACKNMF